MTLLFTSFLIFTIFTAIPFEILSYRESLCKNRSLFPHTLIGQHYRSRSPERRDIRDGSPGVRVDLTLTIVDHFPKCKPWAGIIVQIWHADAIGNYSTYKTYEEPPNPSAEGPSTRLTVSERNQGKHFLRGWQKSDRKGKVRFTTIFPGWIRGRTSHIHLNIRLNNKDYPGQLYFSEFKKEDILGTGPYRRNPYYITPNSRDCEFLCYDGIATVVNLDKVGKNHYKTSAILGFNSDCLTRDCLKMKRKIQVQNRVKRDAGTAPEFGVKCFKPDSLGRPRCRLINVLQTDGSFRSEDLGMDAMNS